MKIIHETKHGFLATQNNSSRYVLSLGNFSAEIRLCEFLNLQKILVQYDLEQMLLDTSSNSDFVSLSLENGKKKVTLTLLGLIRIKDIFEGALHQFKLQDLLFRANVCTSDISEVEIRESAFVF